MLMIYSSTDRKTLCYINDQKYIDHNYVFIEMQRIE